MPETPVLTFLRWAENEGREDMLLAMRQSGNFDTSSDDDIAATLAYYVERARNGSRYTAAANLILLVQIYASHCPEAPIPTTDALDAYITARNGGHSSLNEVEHYVVSLLIHYRVNYAKPMPRTVLLHAVVKDAVREESPFSKSDPHRHLMKVLQTLEEKGIIITDDDGLSLSLTGK